MTCNTITGHLCDYGLSLSDNVAKKKVAMIQALRQSRTAHLQERNLREATEALQKHMEACA